MKPNMKAIHRAIGAAHAGHVTHGQWSAPDMGKRDEGDCVGIDDAATAPSDKLRYPIFDPDGKLNATAVASALGRARTNAPELVPHLEKIDEAIKGKVNLARNDAADWHTLAGTLHTADGKEPTELKVHAAGHVGTTEAEKHCPVGGCIACDGMMGRRTFDVTSHEPHPGGHAGFVVPRLQQTSGAPMPLNLSATDQPMTLHHVAALAEHSRNWNIDPDVHFYPEGEQAEDIDANVFDFDDRQDSAKAAAGTSTTQFTSPRMLSRFDPESGSWAMPAAAAPASPSRFDPATGKWL